MGFRFYNFNSICKTYITTTISSSSRSSNKSHFNYLLPTVNSLVQQPSLIFPNNPNPYIIHKRWHVGHSHNHQHSGKQADHVFKLGLAADIALATGKALTGYLTGSTAIIADAAHSVTDIVLSGVALVSFRVARAPRDKEHPYGHGKFETLGALGISGMLLATAGGIAWHTIDILMGLLLSNPEMVNHSVVDGHVHHHGIDMDHPILALNMTIGSIAVKEGLYWITKRAAEKEGSGLMKASAWHHRADAVSSIVALVGVGGSILGVKFLDPLAGLVVSGMILKAGIETGHQSVMELVDAGVPLPLLEPIKQTIVQVEGVMGCHRLRGRRAGSCIYLDVHIEVDPFSSVSAAHGIGENVRHHIQKSHAEVAEVFIHIDPSLSGLSPRLADQQERLTVGCQNMDVLSHQEHIEGIVSETLSSKFPKVIAVEHITHHLLQGKLLVQIEVSMPADMLIRDAKNVAEQAEKEILKAVSQLHRVGIQLRLGNSIP
ncbi:Cation-efflux pump fief [Thalictrum thalictroides]|uniref:Cation-efflux pump fief n=1 Tax=Thalictrum thalictroides TaxID=46969 RepID=A0A7J6VN81_THATH|nr:Cation-efflux pump fief [Thalictrum thalictroides]